MLNQIFSDKVILIAVTLVGMAICSMGIGQVAARGAWLHPFAIVAYIVGGTILALVIAALLNIPLPFAVDARGVLIAVVVLGLFKVALTQLHRALA